MIIWLVIGEEYSHNDGFLERYWIENAYYTNVEAQERRDLLNAHAGKPSNMHYKVDSIEVKDGQEDNRGGNKKYQYKGPVQTQKFGV